MHDPKSLSTSRRSSFKLLTLHNFIPRVSFSEFIDIRARTATLTAHRQTTLHTSQKERHWKSYKHGKPRVCRLSTARVPPGRSMDKFQRRMPPRHPADRHPLEVYGTTDHGGLLDIHCSGDTTHELYPSDDSAAECLLYVSYHSWRDPDI